MILIRSCAPWESGVGGVPLHPQSLFQPVTPPCFWGVGGKTLFLEPLPPEERALIFLVAVVSWPHCEPSHKLDAWPLAPAFLRSIIWLLSRAEALLLREFFQEHPLCAEHRVRVFQLSKPPTHKRVLSQGRVRKPSKVSPGARLAVTWIVLHCDRCMMLFRETMHRNQTQEQRKHFYPYSAGPWKVQ